MIWILILCAAVWVAAGVAGFVYWWTNDHEFSTDEVVVALVAGGFLGPFSWVVGRGIHGDSPARTEPRVLVPKRAKGKR